MKADLEKVFNNFFDQINWYIKLLQKSCESLYISEKCEVYESFVLKICATWETFINDLFVLCLKRNTSQYSKFLGVKLPKRPSIELCAVLISGYRYLDFRRAADDAAKILTPDNNPFSKEALKEAPRRKRIDEFFSIRNYVAHKSRVAKRALRKVYQDTYHLERFTEPGRFLLSPIHEGVEEIWFGEFIQVFINTAKTMALYLEIYPKE
ncbi:MAG: hypothetical protein JXA81_08035 [Sedimentisphaerales bacterium]|nr:hypothetical protein [Sedimentisphaerales bacterium]